jgi:hypothetical protein
MTFWFAGLPVSPSAGCSASETTQHSTLPHTTDLPTSTGAASHDSQTTTRNTETTFDATIAYATQESQTTTKTYDAVVTESQISSRNIQTTSVEAPTTYIPQCTRTNSDPLRQRSGAFTRKAKDVWFSDSTNLIACAHTYSKRHCADMCLADAQCMSFSFERLDGGLSLCSMYTASTFHGIVERLNSDLYVLKCQ